MSNLLDKASIILTPTAYNNGEALCVKPSDGSGDFDFSRNSAATRVNAQGLVENVQILSSNLVQNGDFSELGSEEVSNGSFSNGSTDWNLGTNWSIGEDKAISDGTSGNLYQSGIIVTGKQYKIQATVSDYVSGNVQVSAGAVPRGTMSANGTYTFYQTASSTSNLFLISNIFNGSITNISVKEVGQNWTLLNGTITDKYNASMTAYQSGIRVTPFLNTGTFKVTFDLVVTSGSCKFDAGGTNNAIYTTSGTKEIMVTDTTKFEFNAFNLGWVGTLDNVSVIQITTDTNLPRINYEGFSYQDALGSEEILNGDFSDGSTGWSVGANSEINNGSARIYSPSGSYTFVSQSNVLTVGKTYLISLEIVEQNLGEIRLSDGVGYLSNSFSGVGVHTFKSTSIGTIFRIQRTASITDIRIDNVSVKEVLGQEVVPDSGCGSWLWEPQSTNLITYSSDYTQWNKSGSMVITSNNAISPDGTQNASLLTANAANQFIYLTAFAAANSTISLYIKRKTGTGDIELSNNGGSSYTILSVTDEWNRVQVTFAAGTNQTVIKINTSGDEIYLWGVQLEQQSYATSYIPTNGEANGVTRNQDVCTNGGSLASINSTEGTLYFEGKRLSLLGSKRTISISDGSLNNYLYIQFQGVSNTVRIFYKTVENGQVLLLNHALTSSIEFGKYAFKWSDANFSLWINGVKEIEQLTGNTATSNVFNTIGFSLGNAADKFFGKTKAVAVWKEALSDEELTELTTI